MKASCLRGFQCFFFHKNDLLIEGFVPEQSLAHTENSEGENKVHPFILSSCLEKYEQICYKDIFM